MAQVFNQYYVNSPNFPPLVRERKDAVRDVDPNLIPTRKTAKSKAISHDFIKSKPSDLFEEIVKDSRGSLANNNVLRDNVNTFFINKLDQNISAVYDNDVRLYNKLEQNDNFHLYEKYIYLISIIIYVNSNADTIRNKLNKDANGIIEWAQLRDDKSLAWRLEGPRTPTSSSIDFVNHYNILISIANDKSSIIEQAKISKINMMYDGISNLRRENIERPNSYSKTLDRARQYYLIIRDERNLLTEIDTKGNLMFDASNLDLGDVAHNETQAEMFSIKVSQEKEKYPPSKMLAKSIQQLFSNFSSISVKEFTLAYCLFNNDISKFPTVFLVFPGIHTSEHTIISEIPRGVLRIAGRFTNDTERRRYVFHPNEEITTFDGSQTFVQNMMFYITTCRNDMDNAIVGNSLIHNFYKTDIYNHVIESNMTQEMMEQSTTYDITEVIYQMPEELSEMYESKAVAFTFYIQNLEFVPLMIRDYANHFVDIFKRYKSLVSEVGDYVPSSMIDANADNLISNSKITQFNNMRELEDNHRNMMQLVGLLNNHFNQYRSGKLLNNNIHRELERFGEGSSYYDFIMTSVRIIDFPSLREFVFNLCQQNPNVLVNIQQNGSGERYLKLIKRIAEKLISLIQYDSNITKITVNPFAGGRINNLEFNISNNKLVFMYSNDESNFNYVTDKENDMILMRFYNDDFTQQPLSSFIYSPKMQLIQWLPSNPINISHISIFNTDIRIMRRIQKDGDYFYMRGGFEEVRAFDDGDNYFAKLTDFTLNYEEANYNNMRFIKYLPKQYMDSSVIQLDIFSFKNIRVTNDSMLYVDNNLITESLEIYNDEYHLLFTLMLSRVTEIDIFDGDMPKIKIRTNPYASLYYNEEIDIAGKMIEIQGIEFERISELFRNDNCFKAYHCDNNLLQKYWNTNSIRDGILISPLFEDKWISETDVIIVNKIRSDDCVIYMSDNGKTFYNLFIAGSDMMLVDSKIVTDPVYVFEDINETKTFEGEIDIAENVELTIDDLTLFLHFTDGKLDRVTCDSFILVGEMETDTFYATNVGSFMISYSDKITSIIILIIRNELSQYLYVDGIVKCRKLYHFDGQLLSSENIESLSPIVLNYHKTLPYVKYWQQNLKSNVYTNNGNFSMVIKNNSTASNVNISIQKYPKVSIDNANDMDIVKSIPYTKKYVSEQISDKTVISEIENNSLRDDNIIKTGGYIHIYDADTVYLSLNVK